MSALNTVARLLLPASLASSLIAATASGQASCPPTWLPTFGPFPGVSGTVHALCAGQDGSGPALYAGGLITSAGGAPANNVARWDGTTWSALGSGLDGQVRALALFDDGSGPALYAGGPFQTAGGAPAKSIAKWDGESWSPLGSGTIGPVNALAVFDDGSGPALYAAAGPFGVYRWNGSIWSPVGGGINGEVMAFSVFDDGGGPALYAGGSFGTAGGALALRIAKWDGVDWSGLGSGLNSTVQALAVHDDGSGPALYAGGKFTSAGSTPAQRVAKWNGSAWSPLGSGLISDVNALQSFDDGSGPKLWAGTTPQLGSSSLGLWNGSSWSLPGGTASGGVVRAFVAFDDGSGPALYAAGGFSVPDEPEVGSIGRWTASGWSPVGEGGLNGAVNALTVHDDGNGTALYVGGTFTFASGVTANQVAKWDGGGFTGLGSGPGGSVYSLGVFDDGGGAELYAGGVFQGGIARWSGAAWSLVGGGLGNSNVYTMSVFDDGTGPALYAGGSLATAFPSFSGVARWDGVSWSSFGGGVGTGELLSAVLATQVFDDGSGPALYAAGMFTKAGTTQANRIAKWDGVAWSALGSGLNDQVTALAVFDGGSGPALYAGGQFTTAGGAPASRIAKWDGATWSALGGGVDGLVGALATYDDGSGLALYAGGFFATAGGVPASRIAKWDGTTWSGLESGMGFGGIGALRAFDDGTGLDLIAGGSFAFSASKDSALARFGCAFSTHPGCAGNPASLSALSPSAPLGAPLQLRVAGLAAQSGLGVVYFGAPGTGPGGCGLFVPGLGELLLALAPAPALAASGALAGGICDVSPPVPATPALSGATPWLQGAAVDLSLASPVELTNGLAVTLGP